MHPHSYQGREITHLQNTLTFQLAKVFMMRDEGENDEIAAMFHLDVIAESMAKLGQHEDLVRLPTHPPPAPAHSVSFLFPSPTHPPAHSPPTPQGNLYRDKGNYLQRKAEKHMDESYWRMAIEAWESALEAFSQIQTADQLQKLVVMLELLQKMADTYLHLAQLVTLPLAGAEETKEGEEGGGGEEKQQARVLSPEVQAVRNADYEKGINKVRALQACSLLPFSSSTHPPTHPTLPLDRPWPRTTCWPSWRARKGHRLPPNAANTLSEWATCT